MKPTDGSPEHGGGHGHPTDEFHNQGVAHESTDVNIRAILSFGVIVVVVSIVCAVIVWGLFHLMVSQAAARDPKMSPLAMPGSVMPRTTAASPYFGNAPSPQLITNEPTVLRTLRQTEQTGLHAYGWVDQKAGVARVPIDQAKKLIAERGLPSRAAGAADPQLGTDAFAFGEANGGRTIPTGERPSAAPPQAPGQPADQTPTAQPAHAPSGRGGGA